MKVAFRVDASKEIGAGHWGRCLTLADALSSRGAEVAFVSRELPGHLIPQAEAKGYPVIRLSGLSDVPVAVGGEAKEYAPWLGVSWEQDAEETLRALKQWTGPQKKLDWLIVDHYAIARAWEQEVRSAVENVFVIDDLANRSHAANILLDQCYFRSFETRYDRFTSSNCKLLLGPRYALLRPSFARVRSEVEKNPRSQIRTVHVFMGGADQFNATSRVLDALDLIADQNLKRIVIIGSGHPARQALVERCRGRGDTELHIQTPLMAELMGMSDLAVGAVGSSAWERACVGLPTLALTLAANQEGCARDLGEARLHRYLGDAADVTAEKIAHAMMDCLKDPEKTLAMGVRSMALTDGCGLERVVAEIIS